MTIRYSNNGLEDKLIIDSLFWLCNQTQFKINYGLTDLLGDNAYCPINFNASNNDLLNNKIYYFNDDNFDYVLSRILKTINFSTQQNLKIILKESSICLGTLAFEFENKINIFNCSTKDKFSVLSMSSEIQSDKIVFYIEENDISNYQYCMIFINNSTNEIKFNFLVDEMQYNLTLMAGEQSIVSGTKFSNINILINNNIWNITEDTSTYDDIMIKYSKNGNIKWIECLSDNSGHTGIIKEETTKPNYILSEKSEQNKVSDGKKDLNIALGKLNLQIIIHEEGDDIDKLKFKLISKNIMIKPNSFVTDKLELEVILLLL